MIRQPVASRESHNNRSITDAPNADALARRRGSRTSRNFDIFWRGDRPAESLSEWSAAMRVAEVCDRDLSQNWKMQLLEGSRRFSATEGCLPRTSAAERQPTGPCGTSRVGGGRRRPYEPDGSKPNAAQKAPQIGRNSNDSDVLCNVDFKFVGTG